MSSNEALPLLLPPPSPLMRQTEAVKEIMAKVVSKQSTDKYVGQNSFSLFFVTSQLNRVSFYWSRGLSSIWTSTQLNLRRNNMQRIAA
jgi:hypothetical protein